MITAMNTDLLIRTADLLITAVLWLMAGIGVLIVTATSQYLSLIVAMAFVLEGFVLARRVLRI